MVDTVASESRDGKGCADNDQPYVWGTPRSRLTLRQLARLTIMRGYVMDSRRLSGLAADGDVVRDN